jgi:hypothetical protein
VTDPVAPAPGPLPSPVDVPRDRFDPFAVAAVVAGALGTGAVAIALGIIGLSRTRRDGTRGRGLAVAGIVLGGLSLLAALLLVVLAVVAGISSGTTDGDRHDQASSASTGSTGGDVFSLAIGDCLTLAGVTGTEVDDLPVTACTSPHDAQVYSSFELSGDVLPGDLDNQASTRCEDAFAAFVGTSWEQSSLDYTYLAPTSDSWSHGDREVLCLATTTGGTVSTTFEGSGL